MQGNWNRVVSLAGAVLLTAASAGANFGQQPAPELKTECFDRDPRWDGRNNRAKVPEPRTVRQDFGYSRTARAGGGRGEIGGLVTPTAEPAYYALPIPETGLDRPLSASGRLFVEKGAGNTLLGFFNAGTTREWRTPNSLVLRLYGRGDSFHTHVEYATRRWRAGGEVFEQPGSGREVREFPAGAAVHSWSLRYDPEGNGGGGIITATLDGQRVALSLEPGHRADGAVFNRFGLLNVTKSADSPGSLWVDDLTVNGVRWTFDRDPKWDGRGNRRHYITTNVRPRFDFGYSRTRHAGGRAAGEMGGLIFRGDERYPERMAYYGDRIGEFSLNDPLRASGQVSLTRGVTDSTTLIGFFHSRGSTARSSAQRSGIPENFLGAAIEGPSREGFYFYPVYGVDRDGVSGDGIHAPGRAGDPPRIFPDGQPRAWTLEYAPDAGAAGRITVTLDGQPIRLDLEPGARAFGARFDRFGIVTTHIDGNAQDVYFDDLTYSCRRGAGG